MTIRLDLLGITGLAPRLNDFGAKAVAIIALVGDERAHGWGERQNIGRSSDIGILALGSDEGRPAGRADRSAHGFLSCDHRASGRLPDCAPPFSAGGTTMSFDRGRVERQRDGIFAELGQRFKDCAPSSALGPTIEAIVDGRVRAVFTRTIAPSRTRLQHVNDAADDAPIVVPLRPCQSRRQMRFDTRPLPVIQPKPNPHAFSRPRIKHAGQRIT